MLIVYNTTTKRVECLEEIAGGSGGGGTSDYTDLSNKPQINSVTLSGNKTSADLGLVAEIITRDTASVTLDILANKNYVLSNVNITDITISSCETSMQETTIQFTTGSNAPQLYDTSGLVWFGGQPILQANTTYVIVIFNKQAFYQEN